MRFSSHPVHGAWCGSRVFPVNCWYCGEKIFVFTCNCGSRVLFEDLGHPWPKHFCNEYVKAESYRILREELSTLSENLIDALSKILPKIDDSFQEEITNQLDRDAPIKRIDPVGGENQTITGIIREIIVEVDPFKKFGTTSNTLAGFQLSKIIPMPVVQLTIHSGVIGEPQVSSYTFWLPREVCYEKDLRRGRIVLLTLKPTHILGCPSFWHAESIEFIDC